MIMLNTIKFDKNKIREFLKQENEFISDVLITYNVPDSVEEFNLQDYLLDNKGKGSKPLLNGIASSADELKERLETIKNKMRTKKPKSSEKSLQKRQEKKLKKNKEYKKVIQSVHKAIKNEQIKSENDPDSADNKSHIKKVTPKPIFNAEGKMVFSKFDFAAHPGAKVKKSKKEKVMKNPRQILTKMKEYNKQVQELKEQGDEEGVKELKTELSWKKAFDKVEGKKVKDDPKLLYKAIKKRKVEKKKSKQQWTERKKKLEQTIKSRQNKRTDNINKKLKDKKMKKLKKLSKKGRVIPGF